MEVFWVQCIKIILLMCIPYGQTLLFGLKMLTRQPWPNF